MGNIRRRLMAAAGGAGFAAFLSARASAADDTPALAALRELEALHGEALELIVRELKRTPPAGREGLLKLLDLLVSAAACRSAR
jgi:hypothetical protein